MKFQEFPIPTELNGEQLKAELGCDEVYVREDKLVIGGVIGLWAAIPAAACASVKSPPITNLSSLT